MLELIMSTNLWCEYIRLLQVQIKRKKQYGPEDIFYWVTAVGNESWVQRVNRRLYRRLSSPHTRVYF
ncbi:hypothetical protein BDV40DRAFT_252967 [Aspergillus tamarii]|uniref:Uncharacterized protein n=1 Tax=Aspergillus tamarii TaxID=41984 RepID=A0A5N6V9G5_ASPTM|nr:hypothetical protein BDV40DRAFT_252967 [Aspergillus tamarii]